MAEAESLEGLIEGLSQIVPGLDDRFAQLSEAILRILASDTRGRATP